jgi:hypothetical protein
MSFSHLQASVILELKEAFNEAQMSYGEIRSLLMAGINPQYVRGLQTYNADRRQLSGDLNSLNSVERLDDGSVPLMYWLKNAQEQFEPTVQAKIFAQALERMSAGLEQHSVTPEQRSDTDAIVEALEALSVLIKKSPPANDAFVIYGNVFQTALDDIDVIADYKLLHEELHGLQLGWPDDIGPTVDKLSGNPRAQMEVRKDSASLGSTVVRLRAISTKGNVDREENKWIDNLDQLRKELDLAINVVAKVQIVASFDSIRSQLTVQLSALNTRLKRAIDTLHLKDLIAGMKKLCDALKDIAGGRFSTQIKLYEDGIGELDVLDDQLASLINQHNDWQGAATRLQTLGDLLEAVSRQEDKSSAAALRLSTLNLIVDTIEKKIEPLHKGWTTQWAGAMMNSAQELRNAVDAQNTDMAESWFYTYREQAWHFFFDLDTEMKNRSEELRRIGDELRKVNRDLD